VNSPLQTQFLGNKLYNYYVTVRSTFDTNYLKLPEERRFFIYSQKFLCSYYYKHNYYKHKLNLFLYLLHLPDQYHIINLLTFIYFLFKQRVSTYSLGHYQGILQKYKR